MIGCSPTNLSIYHLAFKHSSVFNKTPLNNERLEHLGDSVLGMIVTNYLYNRFPFKSEGFLTEMRSKIVSRHQLNNVALDLGLDTFIQYNESDISSLKSLHGNALEALVGAVYIDKGYRVTERFFLNKVIKMYFNVEELESIVFNYKSKLLEWGQKNDRDVEFRLINESVIDKRPIFKIGVFIDGKEIAISEDYNKKTAEQKAAEKSYSNLNI